MYKVRSLAVGGDAKLPVKVLVTAEMIQANSDSIKGMLTISDFFLSTSATRFYGDSKCSLSTSGY